jgi:hypothetical protein
MAAFSLEAILQIFLFFFPSLARGTLVKDWKSPAAVGAASWRAMLQHYRKETFEFPKCWHDKTNEQPVRIRLARRRPQHGKARKQPN